MRIGEASISIAGPWERRFSASLKARHRNLASLSAAGELVFSLAEVVPTIWILPLKSSAKLRSS